VAVLRGGDLMCVRAGPAGCTQPKAPTSPAHTSRMATAKARPAWHTREAGAHKDKSISSPCHHSLIHSHAPVHACMHTCKHVHKDAHQAPVRPHARTPRTCGASSPLSFSTSTTIWFCLYTSMLFCRHASQPARCLDATVRRKISPASSWGRVGGVLLQASGCRAREGQPAWLQRRRLCAQGDVTHTCGRDDLDLAWVAAVRLQHGIPEGDAPHLQAARQGCDDCTGNQPLGIIVPELVP